VRSFKSSQTGEDKLNGTQRAALDQVRREAWRYRVTLCCAMDCVVCIGV
jgi:hypothetical protein